MRNSLLPRKYIRPSRCTKCVPVETHEASNEHAWTVELAHQPDCPNRRRK